MPNKYSIMNLRKIAPIGLLCFTLVLSSCRPGGAEYVSDLDIVATAYAKSADFNNKTTYFINDSIIEIDGDDSNLPTFVSKSSADVLVSQIIRNMNAYGWKQESNPLNADIVFQVAAMETTDIYYYYSYYGYYGYYGWYYPGYYPPTYTTTKSGTLLMQILDRKDISIADKAPVLWVGVVNGMLEGSSASINTRAVSSIDQAFKQSPILKK